MATTNIPEPTVVRLCAIYRICEGLLRGGEHGVSSASLGRQLGATDNSVRRDISYLGEIGRSRAGYDAARLRQHIAAKLGLTRQRKACVVGLGRLGQALLEYERFGAAGFVVVAGFDASINRLETLHTSVRLHAAYDIAAVTRREAIEVGLVAVPAEAAQGTADALVAGGVREILNFAPVALRVQDASVQIRGVDILNELRVLSAQRFLTRDDAEEKRG